MEDYGWLEFRKDTIRIFAFPAIYMVLWGAFCNMVGITAWAIGYWPFFMLNMMALLIWGNIDETYTEIRKLRKALTKSED